MITQQDIYEAAQAAFKQYHPKFPWPKKHGLEDQEDSFKRAFLALCASINILHDEEKKRLVKDCTEFSDIASERYSKIVELKTELKSTRSAKRFLAFLLGVSVIVIAVLAHNLNNTAPDCIAEKNLTTNDAYVKSGSVGVALFDDNKDGVADRTLPFCK